MNKNLKVLIFLGIYSISLKSQAVMIACNYQDRACDRKGNHFICNAIDWSYQNSFIFCSDIDKSNTVEKSTNLEFQKKIPSCSKSKDSCEYQMMCLHHWPEPNCTYPELDDN